MAKQIPFLGNSVNSSSIQATNQAIILQIRLPRILAGSVGEALPRQE